VKKEREREREKKDEKGNNGEKTRKVCVYRGR
jgi:hypothetical protein